MKFGMIAIVIMLAHSAQAATSEAQSLYCRLSHGIENQDFQMEAPVMEETPFGVGGYVGMTTKKMTSGATNVEISLMFVDSQGTKVGVPSSRGTKSVVLGLKVLSEGLMPYSLFVQSFSNINNFSENINSMVQIDSTPLSLDGKFLLWCQSTPIQ